MYKFAAIWFVFVALLGVAWVSFLAWMIYRLVTWVTA